MTSEEIIAAAMDWLSDMESQIDMPTGEEDDEEDSLEGDSSEEETPEEETSQEEVPEDDVEEDDSEEMIPMKKKKKPIPKSE
jgi:hypothetical protein